MLQLQFRVTPIFETIVQQCQQSGFYLHHRDKAKESVQLFRNQVAYEQAEKYLGAIQYEGSNNYEEREPHLVILRFNRRNITQEMRHSLEQLTAFRQDTNSGPAINPSAESIAFKFQHLGEKEKQAIIQITEVLKKFVG